ncbi:Gfo/Idh/MocA family protein [Halosegnis marinus]|uniref:Gfo/Idh/MocA family protein n=1 Tax=Halosegnis marinus TaxID=3034023 RepID=A0ABD5ZSF3_9EURY|nr:Gfo/Idh/MocA family oxidoreductase [Halosegnis sp. DT85]
MSLRTAVVGGGAVSRIHLSGIAENPRTDLVAVCDIDEGRATALADEYGIVAYTDTTDLLAAESLDWLHVCTPVATHFDLAREAIEAGVPVLVEKPITETSEAAARLARLSEEHGVPVSVVRNHLFTSAMRRVRDAVGAGDLGRVRAVDVTYTGNTWPDEPNRGAWTFDLPGGEFEEGIPHPVYVALGVGGYPDSTDGFSATTARVREYEQGFTYDGVNLDWATDDDTLCSVSVLAGAVPQRLVRVHGADASLTADLVSGTVLELDRDYKASAASRALNDLDRAGDRMVGLLDNAAELVRRRRLDGWERAMRGNAHNVQFDREARALEEGTAPVVPPENGEWTIRAMEAIREAAGERAAAPEPTTD